MKPQRILVIALSLCTLLTGCGRNGTRPPETAESYEAVALVRIVSRDSGSTGMGQVRLLSEEFRAFAHEALQQKSETFASTTFSFRPVMVGKVHYPELFRIFAIDPNPQTAKEAANLLAKAAEDYFLAQNQIDLEQSLAWLYTFLESKQNDPDTDPRVLESLKETIEKEKIQYQENFLYIQLLEPATHPSR